MHVLASVLIDELLLLLDLMCTRASFVTGPRGSNDRSGTAAGPALEELQSLFKVLRFSCSDRLALQLISSHIHDVEGVR
jgi:hypothetical protein